MSWEKAKPNDGKWCWAQGMPDGLAVCASDQSKGCAVEPVLLDGRVTTDLIHKDTALF